MTVDARHNCSQGDTVRIANVGGPAAAWFNQEFTVTPLSDREFMIQRASPPPGPPVLLVPSEAFGTDEKYRPMDALRTRIEDAFLMAF